MQQKFLFLILLIIINFLGYSIQNSQLNSEFSAEILHMNHECKAKESMICEGIEKCWRLACSNRRDSNIITQIIISESSCNSNELKGLNYINGISAVIIGRNATCDKVLIAPCATPKLCFSKICDFGQHHAVKIIELEFLSWSKC